MYSIKRTCVQYSCSKIKKSYVRFSFNFKRLTLSTIIKNRHLFRSRYKMARDERILLMTLNLSHVSTVNNLLHVTVTKPRGALVTRAFEIRANSKRKHRLKRKAYALNEHRRTFSCVPGRAGTRQRQVQ